MARGLVRPAEETAATPSCERLARCRRAFARVPFPTRGDHIGAHRVAEALARGHTGMRSGESLAQKPQRACACDVPLLAIGHHTAQLAKPGRAVSEPHGARLAGVRISPAAALTGGPASAASEDLSFLILRTITKNTNPLFVSEKHQKSRFRPGETQTPFSSRRAPLGDRLRPLPTLAASAS